MNNKILFEIANQQKNPSSQKSEESQNEMDNSNKTLITILDVLAAIGLYVG